ncbi:Bifunctional purine biosynthetic protein ade1 [Elasticomyces elasticus]|nr:Bifunctional purine biosynthetic protein ade1 [Elasticomyces elasticus]
MSTTNVVTTIDAKDVGLKKIASGKVREIFEVDANTLLFVATDRISAYDVILENGIPNKGPLLTQLSAHWFDLIRTHIPDLRLHVISLSLPSSIPAHMQPLLASRSMQVRPLHSSHLNIRNLLKLGQIHIHRLRLTIFQPEYANITFNLPAATPSSQSNP